MIAEAEMQALEQKTTNGIGRPSFLFILITYHPE